MSGQNLGDTAWPPEHFVGVGRSRRRGVAGTAVGGWVGQEETDWAVVSQMLPDQTSPVAVAL